MHHCTVLTEGHSWTASTLQENIGVSRGDPSTDHNGYRIELVEDNGDSVVSSLTVVAFAGLDNVTVSCDDTLNPGQGLEEEATISILG